MQVGNRLDLARLDGSHAQPVGVAVSGGGDSLALLHLLHERLERPLHVFCVDHGLNPASADWTRFVGDQAKALGARFTPLTWEGPKPLTGLSAAARQARHALMANAARAAGIKVLCLAHTADDVAEALWMRARGSTVTPPKSWSPSPVWPQGRGVFLLRPLLGVRRKELRDCLRDKGVSWIDDPSNANPDSLRVQARTALKGAPQTPVETDIEPVSGVEADYLGAVRLDMSQPQHRSLRALAMAAVCAGGGEKLPSSQSVKRAMEAALGGQVARLSGARIEARGGHILVVREGGDIGRNRPATVIIAPGQEGMWDGRWSFRNTLSVPVSVSATKGMRTQLSESEQAFLRTLPAALRDTLPVIQAQDHKPSLIINRAFCWTPWRFAAATGTFKTETDL